MKAGSWLPRVVTKVCELASVGRVRFTLKALHELTLLDAGLDERDVCDVLARLSTRQFAARLTSKTTGEWMYVFKPMVAGERVYVKLIVRTDCIVISFHEDDHDDQDP